jgi:hypothetical protein
MLPFRCLNGGHHFGFSGREDPSVKLRQLLAVCAASATLLLAGALPASAGTTMGFGGEGYGPTKDNAILGAMGDAYTNASAYGYTSSQCQQVGTPVSGINWDYAGPGIQYYASVTVSCTR